MFDIKKFVMSKSFRFIVDYQFSHHRLICVSGHWCDAFVSRWRFRVDVLLLYCSTIVIWGRNQMYTDSEMFSNTGTAHPNQAGKQSLSTAVSPALCERKP